MSDGYAEMTGANYGPVSNAAQALTDAYDSITMILDETQAAIGPLQQTWSGVSEQEYETVQARWTSDLQQLQSSLAQAIALLGQVTITPIPDLTFPLPDGG
jgi:WXG100 family type VII secretion target